ncbi:polyprenyl synthetase family protein [Sporolactobacillus pectinivorans]|uniref:polyprenyl synthetase family protein n=1 Tax=Sporolactobacillus pectinivorans TaxID=1591408 RepID=UPI000C264D6D|nr:class 1 isoprenoid biosynthesis enzyme [Sporolactobacillus pectinivorans]
MIKQMMHQQVEDFLRDAGMKAAAHTYVDYYGERDLQFGRLTLLHHEMLGGSNPDIDQIAAAVEWLVLSANIIDDWQDRDRKGPPWMKDEADQALTLENSFLLLALSILQKMSSKVGQDNCLQTITDHLNDALHGQYLDRRNQMMNEDDYISMVQRKSGALAAVASLSGVLASGYPCDLQIVEKYSTIIGVCAQLKNDLRDTLRVEGKSDLVKKKRTLATMYLAEHPSLNGERIALYYQCGLSEKQLVDEKESLEKWIQSSGVILYIDTLRTEQRIYAKELMDLLPVSDRDKERLEQFLG